MDNKKFEKLIDLIINENEEQARELFHDIVVEKSREIYESIMDEEMMEGECDEEIEEGMGGQVGDLLDEINAEEAGGMTEEEDDLDGMDDLGDDGDEVVDIEADDMGDMSGGEGEEVEDAVVRIEDKLDQLMAEFEELMGHEEAEEGGEEDFGDEEAEVGGEEAEVGGEEAALGDEEAGEEMMEAVQLQQVKGLYGSKIGGDNGAQTKSPGLSNSGQAGMATKPVNFSGSNAVPTGPKGPSNYGSKGETQVKGAGSFKNAPGQKGQDLSAATKPVKTQAAGVNAKSPIAEAKKTVKKIVK